MLDLTPETEALARSLAEARGRSVDETVREALQARSSPAAVGVAPGGPDLAARRMAALRRCVEDISRLPDLDKRSAKEIMDDLNPL